MGDRLISSATIAQDQLENLHRLLRRGNGYGVAGPTWAEGKKKRPPPRPRDAKAAARKLVKRLTKHAHGDPGVLRIAETLRGCSRRRRCLHPACPKCGRALQRLLVRLILRFLTTYPELGPWVAVSIILPPSTANSAIDFDAERARYAGLLRAVGIDLGGFALDLSFNEDDRRSRPESQRFAPHACVHLYGLAPAAQVKAALPKLKRFARSTEVVRRPVKRKRFDGNSAAIAYAFKPRFVRRLTIERAHPERVNPVRTTRDRPLTVEQDLRAVRALDHVGLTGRLLLPGLSFEAALPARSRSTPRT